MENELYQFQKQIECKFRKSRLNKTYKFPLIDDTNHDNITSNTTATPASTSGTEHVIERSLRDQRNVREIGSGSKYQSSPNINEYNTNTPPPNKRGLQLKDS